MSRLLLTESMCKFLSSLHADTLITYDRLSDSTYIIVAVDGVKAIRLQGVNPRWSEPLVLPAQITSNLQPGYYEIEQQEGFKLLKVFATEDTDNFSVIYRLYPNTHYLRATDYIPILTAGGYLPNVIPREILHMYSVVTQIGSTINKAVEFSEGKAYMSAKDVKVVLRGLQHTNVNFSLTKNKMSFLTQFGVQNISVLFRDNTVSLKYKESETVSFYSIFGKMTTSTVPKIEILEKREPLYTTMMDVRKLQSLLTTAKENKNLQIMLDFNVSGMCSIKQGTVITFIPMPVEVLPTVNFSIDAITFKKCVAKFKAPVLFKLYKETFTIEYGNMIIIGGARIAGLTTKIENE